MVKRKLPRNEDERGLQPELWPSADSGGPWDDASDGCQNTNGNVSRESRKKKKTEEQAPEISAVNRITTQDTDHPRSTHNIYAVESLCAALSDWYSKVHALRGMPWRKPFDPSQGPEERSQRAYEVWVSEVMLQQTQVATVIPYYKRWMETFPTVYELAEASIDQVNSLWKGLGYYSRASRLLAGAKKVVEHYEGKIPDNAKDLQTNIPGIGRYSAGAICSIAFGERVPVLDGNVHRLISRLLAVHAPPKSKVTLDVLWKAAHAIVQEGEETHPGDINQALIELGSTICKVRDPLCNTCPVQSWCTTYALSHGQKTVDISDIEDLCTMCEPMSTPWEINAIPMKQIKKKARDEVDIVNVVEWRSVLASDRRLFLIIKRPDVGLLAGLCDFATLNNVPKGLSPCEIKQSSTQFLCKGFGRSIREIDRATTSHAPEDLLAISICIAGDVSHVFSHIKKTYRVVWILLQGGEDPPCFSSTQMSNHVGAKKDVCRSRSEQKQASKSDGIWVSVDEVAKTNMGTGTFKVWKLAKAIWEKK